MLELVTDLLVNLIESIGFIGVFIASVIESFFPPLPSEIILFTAGLHAKESNSLLLLILYSLSGAVGNIVGTLPYYLIAKKGAGSFLPKFIEKYGAFLLISNKDLARTEKFFSKRGELTVLLAKLIPGIRSYIAFPAGVAQLLLSKYLIYSLLGSMIWNLVLSGAGFFAYDRKDEIFGILEPLESLMILILVITIVIYLINILIQFYKARKKML
jgi:membrane protein DedA with SNARE-associated domain